MFDKFKVKFLYILFGFFFAAEQNPNDLIVEDVNPGRLTYKNYVFHKSGIVKSGIAYYRCAQMRSHKCHVTLNIDENGTIKCNQLPHNHSPKKKGTTPFSGE